MLQNEYLLAKIGADPAENELQKDPKTSPLKGVNGDTASKSRKAKTSKPRR